MTRYTPSGQVTTIPQNQAEFEKIQTAINDALSRKGDTPNGMEADFDMNSNRILNLPAPSALTEPLRLSDLDSFLGGNLSIDLSSVTKVIDNVDTMKGDSTVNAGDVVFCKKYYSGGNLVEGLVYEIQSSGTADGYIDHAVVNGIAKLIVDGELDFAQAGCREGQDTSTEVQAAVNALKSNPKVSALKGSAKTYQIHNTVTWQGIAGASVKGVGFVRDYGLPLNSNSLRFQWEGNNTDSMFIFDGVTHTIFDGVAFVGKTSTRADTQALVELQQSTQSIPTGFISFRNCTFRDAIDGIKAGEGSTDTNCADVFAEFIAFTNLQNGLKVNTEQGLNYLFNFINVGNCEHAFNMPYGGCLEAHMVVGSGTENVLTVGRGGVNTGTAKLSMVRIEKGSRVTTTAPKIINCPDSAGAYTSNFVINVDTVNTEANTWTGFHNELNNGVKVNFKNVRVYENFINITSSGSRASTATIEGSLFDSNSPVLADYLTSDSSSNVVVKDDNVSLIGSIVTNDYRKGLVSNNITLAADGTWVNAFEVVLPAGSEGVILDLSTVSILQGAGTRAAYRKVAALRSSGTISVSDITPLTTVPSTGNVIELQAVDSGSDTINIQARRVGGSSSVIQCSVSIEKPEYTNTQLQINKV